MAKIPKGAYAMLEGWVWRMQSLSNVTETWWEVGGDFLLARTPTHSPPDVKTRWGTPLLAINTAAFGRVLLMLVAGLALSYKESNKFT
jgi:hypothetical protein